MQNISPLACALFPGELPPGGDRHTLFPRQRRLKFQCKIDFFQGIQPSQKETHCTGSNQFIILLWPLDPLLSICRRWHISRPCSLVLPSREKGANWDTPKRPHDTPTWRGHKMISKQDPRKPILWCERTWLLLSGSTLKSAGTRHCKQLWTGGATCHLGERPNPVF